MKSIRNQKVLLALLQRVEGLGEVGDDVGGVLNADGEAHKVGGDASFAQLLV